MFKSHLRGKKAPTPVILWDRGDILGWTLTPVLQSAGCQVHCVKDLREAMNLLRVAEETGQTFGCLISRAQYLQEKATWACLESSGETRFPVPVVLLKAHAHQQIDTDRLHRHCEQGLEVCSPLTLLETVAPLLHGVRPNLA